MKKTLERDTKVHFEELMMVQIVLAMQYKTFSIGPISIYTNTSSMIYKVKVNVSSFESQH